MCSQEIPNEAKGHNFVAAILEEQDSEVKTFKQPSILNQQLIFLLIIYSGFYVFFLREMMWLRKIAHLPPKNMVIVTSAIGSTYHDTVH